MTAPGTPSVPPPATPAVRRGRQSSVLRVRAVVPELAALFVVPLRPVRLLLGQVEFFLGYDNFLNILTAIAVTGIIAAPGTMLLVAGQVDLSVGSATAFCGIVMASVAPDGSLPVGVLSCVAGRHRHRHGQRLPRQRDRHQRLITTLGTLAVFSGLAKFLIADGQTLPDAGFQCWARRGRSSTSRCR